MKKVKDFIMNFINGFCMALADSVPGVSGGTIAFILGFYDQSHFNKCFKNMVGISPSDFINSGISVQQ